MFHSKDMLYDHPRSSREWQKLLNIQSRFCLTTAPPPLLLSIYCLPTLELSLITPDPHYSSSCFWVLLPCVHFLVIDRNEKAFFSQENVACSHVIRKDKVLWALTKAHASVSGTLFNTPFSFMLLLCYNLFALKFATFLRRVSRSLLLKGFFHLKNGVFIPQGIMLEALLGF